MKLDLSSRFEIYSLTLIIQLMAGADKIHS